MIPLKIGNGKDTVQKIEDTPLVTFDNLLEHYLSDKDLALIRIVYKNLRKTVATELREELLLTLNNSTKIVQKLRILIDRKLAKIDLTDDDVMTLILCQEKLVQIAGSLPKQIDIIKQAERIIESEEINSKVIRGQKQHRDSMDT